MEGMVFTKIMVSSITLSFIFQIKTLVGILGSLLPCPQERFLLFRDAWRALHRSSTRGWGRVCPSSGTRTSGRRWTGASRPRGCYARPWCERCPEKQIKIELHFPRELKQFLSKLNVWINFVLGQEQIDLGKTCLSDVNICFWRDSNETWMDVKQITTNVSIAGKWLLFHQNKREPWA